MGAVSRRVRLEVYDRHPRVLGAPAGLTLATIFNHLRQRLSARGLPQPNQRTEYAAAAFVFARNTAHPAQATEGPSDWI